MGRPNHHTTRIDANPPPYRTCDSHRIRLAQRLQNPSRAFYSTSPLQSSIKLAFPSFKKKGLNGLSPCLFLSAGARNADSCFKTQGLKHSSFEEFATSKLQGARPPAGWALPSSIVCIAWLRPEPRRHEGGRVRVPTAETTSRRRKRLASILVSLGLDIDGESL